MQRLKPYWQQGIFPSFSRCLNTTFRCFLVANYVAGIVLLCGLCGVLLSLAGEAKMQGRRELHTSLFQADVKI